MEAAAGVVLLVAPSALSSLLFSSALAGAGSLFGRIAGGGLLSLGIACWFARATPSSPAGRGVSRALLAYNLIAGVTLALARPPSTIGSFLVFGASAVHGVLSVALLAALFGPGTSPARQ